MPCTASLRDDIAQELRIATWKAISRGAAPHSPIAYLRSSARRLLSPCRQKQTSGPTYLEPDRLSERAIASHELAFVPDYEVERSIVKARLNSRLQGV
jgi:DNA-directed RNA polymerase specialized sigma24 family protein